MITNKFTCTEIIKLVFGIIIPLVPSIIASIFSNIKFLENILPNISVLILIAISGIIYTITMFLLSKYKKHIANRLDWTHRIVTIVIFIIYIIVFILLLSVFLNNILNDDTSKEEIVNRVRMTIGIFSFSVTFTICNFICYSYRKIEQNSRAITCTCIPFKLIENNVLSTYLVLNKSYTMASWMFPGGHFDIKIHDNLENVAIDKAKTEAGLEVTTISTKSLSTNYDKILPLVVPNFFFMYKQNNSARCYYEKGHRAHFDYVYICDVKKEAIQTPIYNILEITIDTNNEITKTYIDECINKQLVKKPNDVSRTVGDYISEMLSNACIEYCKFKSLNPATLEKKT